MRFWIIYLVLAIFLFLAASTGVYFYLFQYNNKQEGIIIIQSNLDNYRIIPEDKGGLDDLNLGIYNMNNE